MKQNKGVQRYSSSRNPLHPLQQTFHTMNKVETRHHCCPINSLSLPGEGWGEGVKSGICLISYPLILAFSLGEKGCAFSTTAECSCPVPTLQRDLLFIPGLAAFEYNLTGQQ
jgi:hypothetical protein